MPYYSQYHENSEILNQILNDGAGTSAGPSGRHVDSSDTGKEAGDVVSDNDDDLDDDGNSSRSSDCELIGKVPTKIQPIPSTSDSLTKRENDVVSGRIPFSTSVNIFYL